MLLPLVVLNTTSNTPITYYYQQTIQAPGLQVENTVATSSIPDVPFYSQFKDILSAQWQKVGCGVTSLAMIIDYYDPNTVSVNTLLKQGIAAGAYDTNAGWTYAGLIGLSQKYGLDGNSYDLGKLDSRAAFAQLTSYLADGPVIVSVHYKFDPKSTIPHLVVINGLDNGVLHYNDPAAKTGDKEISVADFLKGWKKRFIVMRPTKETLSLLQTPRSLSVSL
jgi:ABC-type bacteriocin/lantibiotic exporter with double-glycine peptidase domain